MSNDAESRLHASYLRLMEQDPSLAANPEDAGIEILSDPEEIRKAQESVRVSWRRMGYEGDDFRCGVLAADPFVTLVRDAVRFPDGSLGLHNRLIEGLSVAAIPVWQGRLQLIRIFRHGLREWSWEFPRGAVNPGEDGEQAIRRELREEIGAETASLTDLGPFTPGGSILSIRARLYLAELSALGEAAEEESIAEIRGCEAQTVANMIVSGEIVDGFTIALFARAKLSGAISRDL